MPKLLLKFNAAVIQEIPFAKDSLAVGRKADNDVVIDSPAVSGHHCRICLEGGTYYVEDLDSTNGTFVNEKRIKKSGLHHNDVVGVAKHVLVFLDETQAPRDAPAEDSTLVISSQQPPEPVAAARKDGAAKIGWLRVLKGGAGPQAEYELKGLSTYIGKSDRVQVLIKGTGLFGSAPEVAASIHRKPEGYVLVAVARGYPVVNGAKVTGQVVLKDGDMVDCGATTMQFVLRDAA